MSTRWKRACLFVSVCALAALTVVLSGCLRKPGAHPDKLSYSLPTTMQVQAGEAVPGTNIVFKGMVDDSAWVLINDQKALKRKGDSLNWSGEPIDGVSVDLKLRVVWFTDTELTLAGTAKLEIEDTAPAAGEAVTTSLLKYDGAVAYGLAKGAVLPGSTVVYEGRDEEGAKLSGIDGYPYRKEGDSIVWEGMLRPNVWVQLNVRVVQFDDKGLRLAGIISLWVGH